MSSQRINIAAIKDLTSKIMPKEGHVCYMVHGQGELTQNGWLPLSDASESCKLPPN